MKVLYCFIIMLFTTPVFAQKEANEWYFGRNLGISFKTGKPEEISGSKIIAHEGCASICDSEGKLLFYTNSDRVWNIKHTVMPYGNDLMGGNINGDVSEDLYYGSSAAQAALILPHPGNTKEYYIFSAPQVKLPPDEHPYTSLYSIVDMSKDGGFGEVVVKNFRLPGYSSEKQTATIDCKGTGFWIVTHNNYKNEFYSIHITGAGIDDNYVVSEVGVPVPLLSGKAYSEKGYGFYSCMKLSPDGTLLVSPAGENPIVELFNFNNATGRVSNARVIFQGKGVYGTSFSPDNTKLYISVDSEILQFTVSDTASAEQIAATKKVICTNPGKLYRTLQIGPDKKIYAAILGSNHLDVIEAPNTTSSNVVQAAVTLSSINRTLGLPNIIDNLFNEGKKALRCSIGFSADTVCPGNIVSFKDSSAIGITQSWRWEFPGALPVTSTEKDPKNIYYTKSGNYPVTLVRYSAYYGFDTVVSNVYIASYPTSDAGSDVAVCPGSGAQLGTPAIAGNRYLWTPSAGLDNPAIAQPHVTPTAQTTTYFLKVTNEYGCDAIDSVTVSIGEIQAIVRDTSVCKGSSVLLKATGGSEYEWSPHDGLSATTGASVSASPLETTVYQLIAKSGECRDTAFLKVTVLDAPTADAGSDKEICFGESVELGPVSSEPGLKYQWTPSEGLLKTDVSNPIATVLKTTEYIVEVTNEAGCIAHDTVLVRVGDILKVVATIDTSVCAGGSVQLSAVSEEGVIFKWTPETGLDNPDIATPVAKPLQTTIYTVTAFKNGGLCSAVDSVRIEVLKLPEVTTKDITLCEGESGELEASSKEEIVSWSWTPATGLSNPNIQNPIVTAFKSQVYTVTATNKSGCTAFKTLSVTVTEKENITAVLKSDKAELEPGESTTVKLLLKAENSAGITSFKVLVHFDANVFQFTKYSGKFLNGADNTWVLQAEITAPGELEITANGQTPIAMSELSFELTAYLAKQTTEHILLKMTEINGEVLKEEEMCRTITTEGIAILLKEVCAGDMRLVNVGEFQTALQQITPNPVTNETIEINYSVGIEGEITLEMYNSQGELVKTIFKGNQKTGVFKETFSTEEIPAGVFLVKLSTLQATETQMFTLVK